VFCVQGIIQSGFSSWNTLQPVACLRLPCNLKQPVRALTFCIAPQHGAFTPAPCPLLMSTVILLLLAVVTTNDP
jgi:hypothetical protein